MDYIIYDGTYRVLAIDVITVKHQNIVRPLSVDSSLLYGKRVVGSTVIFETQAHWNLHF